MNQSLDHCLGEVPHWKFAVVFNLLVLFCALVVEGNNPEFSLLGVSALAILCNCLEPKDLWAGASSGAVVSLALLFPIAKSLANTGVPDQFIGKVMGNPNDVRPGLARMFLALLLPSCVFNNTPIVAMMIPTLQSWSKRLGFDVRVMLMPLTFCAQAGGNLSLMGSSINFVAKQIFSDATGGAFELGFFSLTAGGFVLYVVVGVYCTFIAPLLLRGSPEVGDLNPSPSDSAEAEGLYNIAVIVQSGGPIDGISAERAGLHRITGISCYHFPVILLRDGQHFAEGWNAAAKLELKGGDRLNVAATAEGVAELRKVRGLELENEQLELSRLGAKRRSRLLVEASASLRIVGSTIDIRELKHNFRAAVVSISSPLDPGLCRQSYHGYQVQQGDVILLETFEKDVASDGWNRLFGVVRKVPKSSPPRTGRTPDTLRAIVGGLGLLLVASLTITNDERLELVITCALLLCVLFAFKAMSVEEAYEAVNSSVLLTIIGALALGKALEEVKVASCFASGVVSIAQPTGKLGILAGLYMSTFMLGFFVTNAAVVAIMGQIGASIAMNNPALGVSLGEVCLVVVYAASACWCTPYGYQTNLMVMKDGKYTWFDFIRVGGGLQAVHCVVTVLIAAPCARLSFG